MRRTLLRFYFRLDLTAIFKGTVQRHPILEGYNHAIARGDQWPAEKSPHPKCGQWKDVWGIETIRLLIDVRPLLDRSWWSWLWRQAHPGLLQHDVRIYGSATRQRGSYRCWPLLGCRVLQPCNILSGQHETNDCPYWALCNLYSIYLGKAKRLDRLYT